MWKVCFACLVVFVVAQENVNGQDYRNFYKRLNSLRNPVFINSRTGQRTYYEKRDLSSRESSEISRESRESSKEQFPKVRIDVYYETNCPDSMRFITKQLYPLYREMGEVLDIHLYPYGKAYRYFDEDKKRNAFSCQHGRSECYGNSVQACALKLTSNFDDAFTFIDCMERHPRPSDSGPKCARRHSLDWDKIGKCADGEMGYRLTNEMADKTESLNPKLYFVPWIVFDGICNLKDIVWQNKKVFDERDFRRAVGHNLKAVVCKRYKGDHASCAKA